MFYETSTEMYLAKFLVSSCILLLSSRQTATQTFDDRNSGEVYSLPLTQIFPPAPGTVRPPACGGKAAACSTTEKYRRLDGSCNNIKNPEWGSPMSVYARILWPAYSDGISSPRMATDKTRLPGARALRVDLFPTGQIEDLGRTLVTMQWGQFVAHDMSMTSELQAAVSCCTSTRQLPTQKSRFCYPIKVSASDPTQGLVGIRCMNFTRSITDRDMGCSSGINPARQFNAVTSFLDLSLVYGNSDAASNSLRSKISGQLLAEIRSNKIFPPSHSSTIARLVCSCNNATERTCYRTGDGRMNQSPHLAILHILLLREHNRLAKGLKVVNPSWDDERLFQEARRINIAQYQRMTYYEWLPALLGWNNLILNRIIYPAAYSFVNDYNATFPPHVSSEHAQAAFRHFHSQIAGSLRLMDDQRIQRSNVKFGDWFNRPEILEQGTNMDQLTIGMVTQPTEDADRVHVREITEQLFTCRSSGFGLDMKAIDIQRDRDHGLRYYNDYRRVCGLKVATSFDDFKDFISLANIALLKKHYKSHLDVDLSVGGSLEVKIPGTQVGPTFFCILQEQFARTRKADRFWFENSGSGLTLAQLVEIRKSSFARLLCDNGDGITKIQQNPFLTAPTTSLKPCSQIPVVNLAAWKA